MVYEHSTHAVCQPCTWTLFGEFAGLRTLSGDLWFTDTVVTLWIMCSDLKNVFDFVILWFTCTVHLLCGLVTQSRGGYVTNEYCPVTL